MAKQKNKTFDLVDQIASEQKIQPATDQTLSEFALVNISRSGKTELSRPQEEYPEKIELGENVKPALIKRIKLDGVRTNKTFNIDPVFDRLIAKGRHKEEFETKGEFIEHILTTYFRSKDYAQEFLE